MDAIILVDRKSQKGILLGKKGSMIREIKQKSIRRIKRTGFGGAGSAGGYSCTDAEFAAQKTKILG